MGRSLVNYVVGRQLRFLFRVFGESLGNFLVGEVFATELGQSLAFIDVLFWVVELGALVILLAAAVRTQVRQQLVSQVCHRGALLRFLLFSTSD